MIDFESVRVGETLFDVHKVVLGNGRTRLVWSPIKVLEIVPSACDDKPWLGRVIARVGEGTGLYSAREIARLRRELPSALDPDGAITRRHAFF